MGYRAMYNLYTSRRDGKRPFYGPVSPYSEKNEAVTNSRFMRPLRNALRLSTKSNHVIFASIVGLFHRRRPLNIARLVMAVVVDAVQGMVLRGTWANFRVKFLKRCEAKFNAASAICVIFMVGRIKTAPFSFMVSTILRRLSHAMRSATLPNHLMSQTTATSTGIITQAGGNYLSQLPAVTSAQPLNERVTTPCDAQHCQASESASFEVNKGRMFWFGQENNIVNVKIESSHGRFTSLVNLLSVRLGRGVSASRRAVSILPQQRCYV